MTGVKVSGAPDHRGIEDMPAGVVGAAELFRDHAGFAASLLHRLGVPPRDVPDLVQDVFLLAHRKGGFSPGPAKPRTWIAAIAVRIAAQYRRKRREQLDPIAVEGLVSAGADRVEVRESLARVQRCLDTLDFDHRTVFVLFEVAGESCQDIATALEIPIGTVYSRLHNARKRFADAHAAEQGGEP